MKPDVDGSFRTLVDAVAGPEPLPAGGAAGVAALAIGTALAMKVLRISQQHEAAATLARLLEECIPQFRGDCDAFQSLLDAFHLSREDTGRKQAIEAAWHAATAAPVRVASLARRIEVELERGRGDVKKGLQGDLSAALDLVRAGQRIARNNARENSRHLDPKLAEQLLEALG